MSAAGQWTGLVIGLLETLRRTQATAIQQAAGWCADAIGDGHLVYLFGTGHSRMAVEEMFPRYGSYPGFMPLVELSTTFHTEVVGTNGQRQAMFLERVEGLAEVILANFAPTSDDVMVVFSTGGVTASPIEMAIAAQKRGMKVVAVTAVQHSLAGPSQHSSGTRLLDHADLVIDLGIPVGDAAVDVEGLDVPVGPASSAVYVAVVNEIKVQTAELLVQRDAMPPVLTSASITDAADSAARFDAAYAEHARRLAGALAVGPTPRGKG